VLWKQLLIHELEGGSDSDCAAGRQEHRENRWKDRPLDFNYQGPEPRWQAHADGDMRTRPSPPRVSSRLIEGKGHTSSDWVQGGPYAMSPEEGL